MSELHEYNNLYNLLFTFDDSTVVYATSSQGYTQSEFNHTACGEWNVTQPNTRAHSFSDSSQYGEGIAKWWCFVPNRKFYKRKQQDWAPASLLFAIWIDRAKVNRLLLTTSDYDIYLPPLSFLSAFWDTCDILQIAVNIF